MADIKRMTVNKVPTTDITKLKLELTPEEEAEIQRQIAEDPDTWTVGPDAKVLKRGRPFGAAKEQVTLRLDKDILERLKSQGKGWQTRLNALLREALEI